MSKKRSYLYVFGEDWSLNVLLVQSISDLCIIFFLLDTMKGVDRTQGNDVLEIGHHYEWTLC